MSVQNQELVLGTAGEHLVCADLILSGHLAFMAGAGLPFDVAFQSHDRIFRVAVKSTRQTKFRHTRKHGIKRYNWNVNRSGRKRGENRYDPKSDADIVALVALDIRFIAYLPVFEHPLAVTLDSPIEVPEYGKHTTSRPCRKFSDFSLEDAISTVEALR